MVVSKLHEAVLVDALGKWSDVDFAAASVNWSRRLDDCVAEALKEGWWACRTPGLADVGGDLAGLVEEN